MKSFATEIGYIVNIEREYAHYDYLFNYTHQTLIRS